MSDTNLLETLKHEVRHMTGKIAEAEAAVQAQLLINKKNKEEAQALFALVEASAQQLQAQQSIKSAQVNDVNAQIQSQFPA